MKKLYIRIGEIPEQELNHRFDNDLSVCSGISVFECFHELDENNKYVYKLVLPLVENDKEFFNWLRIKISLIKLKLLKVFIVSGLEVDKGVYSLPILKNINVDFELILDSNKNQFYKHPIN